MIDNPYFKNLNTAVFDIETTGLAACRDPLIVGGLYSFNDNTVLQFFCEDLNAERETIMNTAEKLSHFDTVITYNGISFDHPFLLRRAKEKNVILPESLYHAVDIYKWLRIYWPQAKRMQNLRQKSVEEALGLGQGREDLIGGSDCLALYNKYIFEKDETAKQAILLHNRDDLLQLKRIAESLSFLPYHKIAYEQGFVIKENLHKMIVLQVSLKKTLLTVTGIAQKKLKKTSIYKESYHFDYNADSGKFLLSINCEESNGLIYADIKELPVDSSNYAELSGFFRSLLILKDEENILYYEINKLVYDLINHILREDLLL